MGMETGDGEMGVVLEPTAEGQQHRQFVTDELRGQRRRHLLQRQMRGGQQGVQSPTRVGGNGSEQHRTVGLSRQFGQPFRLAWVVMPRRMPEVFCDRCCHQGPCTGIAEAFHSACEPVKPCSAASRTRVARFDRLFDGLIVDLQLSWISKVRAAEGQQPLMNVDQAAATSNQQRLELIGQGIRAQGFESDLHADPRRITKGNHQSLGSVR